jgi:tetratricopeptide (TPR) repeat protein
MVVLDGIRPLALRWVCMTARSQKAWTASILAAVFLWPNAISAQSVAEPLTGNLSLIQNAAKSLAAGDLTQAEHTLNLVLQSAPDDFRALNLLGIVRAQQQREPEAEKLLHRAIELKPEFTSAHMSLGMLYLQMSKPDEAVLQFQEALRLDADRSDARSSLVGVWRQQAHEAVGKNDPEKALSLLVQAQKVSPHDPDTLYDLGMVELKMSLFPDAILAFTEAGKLRKDDANALYGLGRAQMAIASFEEARETFDRYCELHPSDASGHYALGMTFEALLRTQEAQSQFEKSIALQPVQTESYLQIGRIKLEAGDGGGAQAQFQHVLARDPHHAGALLGSGRLKFEEKDYPQAIELLEKAIVTDASLREAHYYLGMTYARMNRRDDSEKELAIAARLEHEEVIQHQHLLRMIDSEEGTSLPRK